jgi:putative Holliday junction resolvase
VSRVLGVDLGSRRIGLAATDRSGVLASPVGTVERRGDRDAEHREILDAAADLGATTIVVGLPLSLDGSQGPAAIAVLDEVGALRELAREAGVEIDTYDERFSTVTAEHDLRAASGGRRPRRDKVDAAAATVILQSWLEARR